MTLTRTRINGQAARSVVGRNKDKPLTYDAVGMSLGRVPAPEGFREHTAGQVVGRGEEQFRNIGYALMHWDVQRGAGQQVQPEFNVVRPGDVVAVAVKTAPFISTAGACRVIDVIATGRTIGFAYGTLPGHPESGEESFILTHREDDSVEMTLRAFSRPGVWYVRLAGPIGHAIQRREAKRILKSAAAHATVSPVSEAAHSS